MKLPLGKNNSISSILGPVSTLSKKIGNKSILITAVIIIGALIADTALEKIAGLIGAQSSGGDMNLALFIIISVVAYGIGQYLVLSFIKNRNNRIINAVERKTGNKGRFVLTQRVVFVTQYVLTAMLSSVILIVIFGSYYYSSQLIFSIVVSYGLAIFLLGLLSIRFFSWYRSNKNLVVLSYGFACAIITASLVLGATFMISALLNHTPNIRAHVGTSYTIFSPDSVMGVLYSSYTASGIISFLSMWVSTALLLRNHARKLGRVKFWLLVVIPLAYFITPFIPSLLGQIATPLMRSDPLFAAILFTLIFAASKPVGGILFGIAFWTVARAVRESTIIRDYMIMSALGVVALFVSVQGDVIAAYYPPFGLVTVSYVGLSAFMMIVGLYSSAMSVSEDDKLRKSIRKNAMEESKLLDSIGTAQMGQEIERKVMQIERKVMEMAKENADEMEVETGIKPSLEEPDMKKYLEEVMQEVSLSIKSKQPRPSG